jgi:hypothetical protein
MVPTERVWGGSLHQTFRLFPVPSEQLEIFLSSDGATQDEVLARLPYEAQRAQSGGTGAPDPRRYRDGRHVYQYAGLLFEDDSGRLRVTELGKATHRWMGKLRPGNLPVLGRHAAYALAVCQLRNPSRAGSVYASDVEVFPFAFIWRAMLALDGRINSNELNRELFRVTDWASLDQAVERIRENRGQSQQSNLLHDETVSGNRKNDRIIPWICLASFGWLLIADKRELGGDWYRIRPQAHSLLQEATQIKHQHREFSNIESYVRHISGAACLPQDVR